MKRTLTLVALLAAFAMSASLVQAELQYLGEDSLGNGLIYDTDLDITWYDFTHAPDTWFNHVSWAENLTVTFGVNTYDDWRLPVNVDGQYATTGHSGLTLSGWNITSSELGHLFYAELGNEGSRDLLGALTGCGQGTPTCLTDVRDFQNLVSGRYYSSDHAGISYYAWFFDLNNGYQYVTTNYESVVHGIAVRPGMAASEIVAQEATTWGSIKANYR